MKTVRNSQGASRTIHLVAGAILLSLLVLTWPSVVDSQNGGFSVEYDTDRGGSDYKNYEVSGGHEVCRDACANDANCKAYTYVKPWQGYSAKCWLKNSVPPPVPGRDCCISGVKGGGGGGNTSGGGGALIGEWDGKCCNDYWAFTLIITKHEGNTFSGEFSGGWGAITNGQVRGNTIEFDRSGGGQGTQHWTAQVVNDRGRLLMINGVWSGSREDEFRGRTNWQAGKR